MTKTKPSPFAAKYFEHKNRAATCRPVFIQMIKKQYCFVNGTKIDH
jgi:hypothetical protein